MTIGKCEHGQEAVIHGLSPTNAMVVESADREAMRCGTGLDLEVKNEIATNGKRAR